MSTCNYLVSIEKITGHKIIRDDQDYYQQIPITIKLPRKSAATFSQTASMPASAAQEVAVTWLKQHAPPCKGDEWQSYEVTLLVRKPNGDEVRYRQVVGTGLKSNGRPRKLGPEHDLLRRYGLAGDL